MPDRETEISAALKQLTRDHQQGRLSLAAYRRLRRALLDKADKGQDILPPGGVEVPATARPGIIVWLAFVAIVLLIAIVAWLLR